MTAQNGGGVTLFLPDEIGYAEIPGFREDDDTGLLLPESFEGVDDHTLGPIPEPTGTAISLFSGCGGFDIGTTMAGFETRVFIEIEKNAVATLRHNVATMGWHHAAILDCPIETLSIEQVLFAARLKRGECDLITGGFPCQPFSQAGKQKGTKDERGHLFYECSRMIDGIQPKFFVLENVPGMLTSSKGDDVKVICREFDRLGYSFAICLLNAANYGVPQNRRRIFFVGVRPDMENLTGEAVALGIAEDTTHSPHPPIAPFQPVWRWTGSELVQINEPTREQRQAKAAARDEEEPDESELTLFGAA